MPRAVSLLPCPCCGAEAQVQYGHVSGDAHGYFVTYCCFAYVVCSCGLRTANQHGSADTVAAALAAAIWNRREWMPHE